MIGLMKLHQQMTNQEISRVLRLMAAAYEVKKENRFKIIAYQRAAEAVAQASSEMKDLWDEGKLTTVAGIGANLAGHLDELFRTGRVKHFERMTKDLPAAMFEFLEIPGLGPKTSYKLAHGLSIKSQEKAIDRLKEAARKGKVRNLEGFGVQSERQILKNILELKKREDRLLLALAAELAQPLVAYLAKHPSAAKVEVLGSLRRGCATVGDIDLAVQTSKPQAVIDYFVRYPQVAKVVNQGRAKAMVILKNKRQIDLRVQSRSFGAMLQYFTGSKQHNIQLRELALKKGLSLSEYGIKKIKNLKLKIKNFEDEKNFYNYLGLAWIPPELREGQGEIEAAQKNQLLRLVKLSDIKGDLHIHSNFQYQESSHDEGVNSFPEIIFQAIELGYEYVGLSDHSPSVSQHTPSQIMALLRKRKETIEQLKESKKFTQLSQRENGCEIKILNTMEVDILADGSLAVPDQGLALLDFAAAAIHSSMRQSRQAMTERVLRGLSHPQVKFLTHPTGRLLLQREGYELDWEKIFAFCRQNDKWLEINAMPKRLDLPDFLIREAIKVGVKLVINTDAHQTDSMRFLEYGVIAARRGWAEKKDIINVLPWQQFQDKMKP